MIDEGEYEGVAKYFRKMTSKGPALCDVGS